MGRATSLLLLLLCSTADVVSLDNVDHCFLSFFRPSADNNDCVGDDRVTFVLGTNDSSRVSMPDVISVNVSGRNCHGEGSVGPQVVLHCLRVVPPIVVVVHGARRLVSARAANAVHCLVWVVSVRCRAVDPRPVENVTHPAAATRASRAVDRLLLRVPEIRLAVCDAVPSLLLCGGCEGPAGAALALVLDGPDSEVTVRVILAIPVQVERVVEGDGRLGLEAPTVLFRGHYALHGLPVFIGEVRVLIVREPEPRVQLG